MKTILISIAAIAGVIILAVMLTGGGNEQAVGVDGLPNVQVISSEVDDGEATLLDVRTKVEYDLQHATIAEQFNVEDMKAGKLPDYDKDHRLYLYCNSGNRTKTAAEILKSAGYSDVVDLGAFSNWTDNGGESIQSELDDYRSMLEEMGAAPLATLGPNDAELTIVKYSDFQCPYCATYTLETEPQILDNFVKNDDARVKYVFQNTAYLGDESALAAIGTYCANEQELFWKYHDQLTADFARIGPGIFSYENLTGMMRSIGGDGAAFEDCLRSSKYDNVVSSEALDAKNQGINATPAFRIGEQVVNGALPYGTLEAAINAQL